MNDKEFHAAIVYAPTPKAVRKNVLAEDERLVLFGDGTAAVWKGDMLQQSDLLYKGPDSHIWATNEKLPTSLFATQYEINHIAQHKIVLPFKLVAKG